jgi:hypothetical protein
MTFLTREQFTLLHGKVTEFWRPFVKFLVATGCRWAKLPPCVRAMWIAKWR